MQGTSNSWGCSWRILKFKEKPTVEELQKALEEHNKEFDRISIINFKLLNKREIALD